VIAVKVLIVYESMYGNTAAIGRAIADGVRTGGAEVSLVGVDDAAADDALAGDLLVVGGPTHAHGMTRTATRKTAIEDEKNRYEEPTMGPGLRDWLGGLHGDSHPATAFDTRFDGPAALTGSASKGIAKGLTRHGFRLVADRESFLVTKENTLVDGELERARAWGTTLASLLVTA
jgi:flavodoxin